MKDVFLICVPGREPGSRIDLPVGKEQFIEDLRSDELNGTIDRTDAFGVGRVAAHIALNIVAHKTAELGNCELALGVGMERV